MIDPSLVRPQTLSPTACAELLELSRRAARWSSERAEAAVCAARYFLYWQIAKHGAAFAARKRKSEARADPGACLEALAGEGDLLRSWLVEYLERYQFRDVRSSVCVALSQWLRGRWPLLWRTEIPRPREVLRAQARGVRPVTAILAYPRLLMPVLGKPDAYAFFLHDLEHAYKFFHSPALYAGQCAFFAALEAAFDRGVFAPYFTDPVFVEKFHYLMSDMNTHPVHSEQYLRAILIECALRREREPPTAPLSAASERAIDGVMAQLATAERSRRSDRSGPPIPTREQH